MLYLHCLLYYSGCKHLLLLQFVAHRYNRLHQIKLTYYKYKTYRVYRKKVEGRQYMPWGERKVEGKKCSMHISLLFFVFYAHKNCLMFQIILYSVLLITYFASQAQKPCACMDNSVFIRILQYSPLTRH